MEKIRKRSFTEYEAIQPFFIDQTHDSSQLSQFNNQMQQKKQEIQIFSQRTKFRVLNVKKEKFFYKKVKKNRNSINSQISNQNFSTIESLKKQALAIQTAEFLSSRISQRQDQSSSELNIPLTYIPKDQFKSSKRVSLIESFRQRLKILNQRPTQQKKIVQLLNLSSLNENTKFQKTRRRYLSEKKSCTSLTASRFYRPQSMKQKKLNNNSSKVLCEGVGYKRTKKQLSLKSKNTL